MMNEHAYRPTRETNDERLLQNLVSETTSLLHRYEREDDAIWMALSNMGIYEREFRIRLFKKIKTLLEQKKHSELRLNNLKKKDALREARAHELRQPRDAWDPAYDPNEPEDK